MENLLNNPDIAKAISSNPDILKLLITTIGQGQQTQQQKPEKAKRIPSRRRIINYVLRHSNNFDELFDISQYPLYPSIMITNQKDFLFLPTEFEETPNKKNRATVVMEDLKKRIKKCFFKNDCGFYFVSSPKQSNPKFFIRHNNEWKEGTDELIEKLVEQIYDYYNYYFGLLISSNVADNDEAIWALLGKDQTLRCFKEYYQQHPELFKTDMKSVFDNWTLKYTDEDIDVINSNQNDNEESD